jgi:hypothetical protein
LNSIRLTQDKKNMVRHCEYRKRHSRSISCGEITDKLRDC